jgi:RND family efflux transporter MFP subunit
VSEQDQQLSSDLASLRISRGDDDLGGRRRRWPYVLAVLGIGTGGYLVYQRERPRLVAPEVQLGAVTLISPSQADVRLVATGYVVSRQKATLAARVPGRVMRLYVDEGARIKAGQLVAELDRSDVLAQLSTARADAELARVRVDEQRATLLDAEIKAKRARELAARAAGTQADVDDANARVAMARAQVESAKVNVDAIRARIRSAEVALDYTRVRAPFSATVLRKLTEVGEMQNPSIAGGSGGLYTIAALDALEVEADVSETQLGKVLSTEASAPPRPNTTPLASPEGGAPAEIVLDAFPDRRFRGKVSDFRPTVDRAKATVTVKVRFVDPTDGVLPDMSAKVSFLSKAIDEKAVEQAPKRVVPADAVTERDGQRIVFVVDKDRVHSALVRVKGPFGAGNATGASALVELSDGPAPGAQVVRAPAAELVDGGRIKLPE